MPTTRAALVTYIGARLGDRRWRPGAALVRFADRPRFKLESFEGLAVYAALLLHASDRDLESVAHLAARDPIIAAIRATRGLEIAAPPVGADLLAAIYRDPASDAARAVYADFLIDRGDDRGELIAAQLAGEQPPIAGDQAVAWAGAVGPVLRYRPPFAAERPAYTPRIRRGFLSGARVDAIDPPEAAEWSTVEVLDCGGSIAGLGDCDLRSLIGFGGLDGGVLRRLVDAGLAGQLVALGLAGGEVDRDALDRFTALRIAVCGAGFDDLAALLEHPASARLELLAVAVDAEVPGDIGARIVRLPRSLATGHCLPLYDEIIAAAPRRSS
jgi:uncharacterized protein (TIGR02996 family)